MQKNISNSKDFQIYDKRPFSDVEISTLKGIFSKIGKKHNVSHTYVSQIAKGERKTKTNLSKLILSDLQNIVKVLPQAS